MKRKNTIISIIVILLLAILSGVFAVMFHAGKYVEASAAEIVRDYNKTPSLGDLLNLEVNYVLPWQQNTGALDFIPGDGWVQQGDIKEKTVSWTLNGRHKRITIPVRSYRSGDLEKGTLKIHVERGFFRKGPKKTVLTVPFARQQVQPLKTTDRDKLPLADEMFKKSAIKKSFWFWLVSLVIVIAAVAVIIYMLLRKQKRVDSVPPWVIARRDLDELLKTANANKLPLEWCVVRLSDVVRNYLSMRFNLQVKQQTTEEFFASLKHGRSPLNDTQTFYLGEFMKQTDLVKFANIKTNKDAFSQAVAQAERLVDETGAAEADNSKEGEE